MIAIRTAKTDDYPAIAELTVDAYEAHGHLATPADASYRAVLGDVAGRSASGEILVADEAGAVLGAVLLPRTGSALSEIAGPGEVEFRMLAVSSTAQRRGIGELLVRACLDRARAQGAARVVICARDFVVAPLRLYARLGFERTPDRDWSPRPGVNLVALRYDLR